MKFQYIEAYFKQTLSDEEKIIFEKRISSDKIFAADVAYYIVTKQALKKLLLEQKQAEWNSYDLTKVDFSEMTDAEISTFLKTAKEKNLNAFNRFLTEMMLADARRKK